MGIVVPAGRRDRLERLCRYALRPPVGQDRLQLMPDGTAVLELRRRWTHLGQGVRQTQVSQDAPNHRAVLNQRHEFQPARAARTRSWQAGCFVSRTCRACPRPIARQCTRTWRQSWRGCIAST